MHSIFEWRGIVRRHRCERKASLPPVRWEGSLDVRDDVWVAEEDAWLHVVPLESQHVIHEDDVDASLVS